MPVELLRLRALLDESATSSKALRILNHVSAVLSPMVVASQAFSSAQPDRMFLTNISIVHVTSEQPNTLICFTALFRLKPYYRPSPSR